MSLKCLPRRNSSMPQPDPTVPATSDVRMKGFARRVRVEQAWDWLASQLRPLPTETVALHEAWGRVLSESIVSAVDVPGFPRAMMDGYAVVAADTEGATAYNPLPLQVVDVSLPGAPAHQALTAGQAIRIMTGAPVPQGADAVLPVERVTVETEQILVQDAVARGKHIGPQGEDIVQGHALLPAGRQLRPQDVGVLSSTGNAELPVVRRPRVRVVVTGNELLPAGAMPAGYQIVDANGPMLQALIARDGGIGFQRGIVEDTPQAILAAMQDDADIILVSGGSSVGEEDHAPTLLREHGELAIHGIAMRPSSPAGMGRLGDRLVFLLPGNPVSCLCAYDFFAGRAIRALGGRATNWPYREITATLSRKLVSAVGRVDYARVRQTGDQVEPLAISGASVLSSTTRADGFVIIPQDSEGYPAGATVQVMLYDETPHTIAPPA